ncbi:transmembrane protein 178B-like [Sinocyclocheilus grahami]|uniref:transmembrane protein 178B-like n=1 Tax=Sinocyclocheilus grahami TaxID=75366 RepID=UPI0007AD4704|nr:PREDICTED: transmembrane protein 178B-like [Sinocyclocheilus grahami]
MRILTASGLFLAFCSIGLLTMAISTDYWYETDARKHRDRCKKYASKRNDPGYIYISNQNLPLRTRPKASPLRESPHPEPVVESRCSRRYNSTTTGLWRKCHREGFDLENEDLIFKGDDDAKWATCEQYPDLKLMLQSCSVFMCLLNMCEGVRKNAWRYPRC